MTESEWLAIKHASNQKLIDRMKARHAYVISFKAGDMAPNDFRDVTIDHPHQRINFGSEQAQLIIGLNDLTQATLFKLKYDGVSL